MIKRMAISAPSGSNANTIQRVLGQKAQSIGDADAEVSALYAKSPSGFTAEF